MSRRKAAQLCQRSIVDFSCISQLQAQEVRSWRGEGGGCGQATSRIITYETLGMRTAVLQAAALGFLSLGAQPPTPEWGAMLSEGKQYIQPAPHMASFPGLAVFTLVLGCNLFGDGLRDILDPSLR